MHMSFTWPLAGANRVLKPKEEPMGRAETGYKERHQ